MEVALEKHHLDTPILYRETWGNCQPCDASFCLGINLMLSYLFYYISFLIFTFINANKQHFPLCSIQTLPGHGP